MVVEGYYIRMGWGTRLMTHWPTTKVWIAPTTMINPPFTFVYVSLTNSWLDTFIANDGIMSTTQIMVQNLLKSVYDNQHDSPLYLEIHCWLWLGLFDFPRRSPFWIKSTPPLLQTPSHVSLTHPIRRGIVVFISDEVVQHQVSWHWELAIFSIPYTRNDVSWQARLTTILYPRFIPRTHVPLSPKVAYQKYYFMNFSKDGLKHI